MQSEQIANRNQAHSPACRNTITNWIADNCVAGRKLSLLKKKNVNSQRFCLFPFLGFRESYSLSTPQLSQSKFEKKKKKRLHYRCGDTHHGKMDFSR